MVFVLNELLLNTYEHVALKIRDKEKYIKNNEKIPLNENVKVNIKICKAGEYVILNYCDSGEGFNLMLLSDLEDRKYHARGIKMIKSISSGIFFNEKGNCVKVYLKNDTIS
jgi:hypothetical protein